MFLLERNLKLIESHVTYRRFCFVFKMWPILIDISNYLKKRKKKYGKNLDEFK